MSEGTQNLDGGRSFEERVFARFDAMEVRFDAIDRLFEAVDKRFDAVDQRFNALDRRFDGFEESVSQRFETVNQRFVALGRRFDSVDLAIVKLDARVEKLEIRAYDTKPVWEQAINVITETKHDLSRRINRIEAVAYETRADLRDLEDRFDKLEEKPSQ